MLEQLREWIRQVEAGSLSERDLYPLVKGLVEQQSVPSGEPYDYDRLIKALVNLREAHSSVIVRLVIKAVSGAPKASDVAADQYEAVTRVAEALGRMSVSEIDRTALFYSNGTARPWRRIIDDPFVEPDA